MPRFSKLPKLNFSELLRNKNVLYVVAFLSVTNVLSYLLSGNFDAIVFFSLIGYLTTYFSKNMIIVLLTAMLTTNFLVASRYVGRKKEGLANNEDEEADDAEKHDDDKDHPDKAKAKKAEAKDKKASKDDKKDGKEGENPSEPQPLVHKIESFEDISGEMGLDSHNDMAGNVDQIDKLMKNFEKLAPTIDKANELVNKVKPMQEGLEGMIGKLTAMGSQFNPSSDNKQ